jgi:hypothetical protein
MTRNQALRWLHLNAGLNQKGIYSVTRKGETLSNKDWNQLRSNFLELIARVG